MTLKRPAIEAQVGHAIVGLALTVAVLIASVILSPPFAHWFVVPVLGCGILCSIDASRWFQRDVSVFDPVAILGLLLFHQTFLAPILHVHWDYWLPTSNVVPPRDWRSWLGAMAGLNFISLLIYRLARVVATKDGRMRPTYLEAARRFWLVVSLGLLAALSAQVWIYARLDGFAGYMRAAGTGTAAFRGLGPALMIAEAFPVVAMFGFAQYARTRPLLRRGTAVVLALGVFTIFALLFGGLRGSRSTIVWGLFWAVGIVHLVVRRFSKRTLVSGAVLLLGFMYVYGFYKQLGSDGLRVAFDATERRFVAATTGRSGKKIILTDLARADIQAFLLFRTSGAAPETLAYGRTYLSTLAMFTPRGWLENYREGKERYGTEILYGHGTYDRETFSSSHVYGLAGEAMLNFGAGAVPVMYGLLGLAVGLVQRTLYRRLPGDLWLMITPWLVNALVVVLSADSDNVFFFVVKSGAVPILILLLGGVRRQNAASPIRSSSPA